MCSVIPSRVEDAFHCTTKQRKKVSFWRHLCLDSGDELVYPSAVGSLCCTATGVQLQQQQQQQLQQPLQNSFRLVGTFRIAVSKTKFTALRYLSEIIQFSTVNSPE